LAAHPTVILRRARLRVTCYVIKYLLMVSIRSAMSPRERLPTRRECDGFDVEAFGLRFHATTSTYPDGRLVEVFLDAAKAGSAADATARDAAVLCSLALQHGVPLDVIRKALMRDARGAPSSPLGVVLDRLAEESAMGEACGLDRPT
jgi:hypothetical protein